MHISTLAWMTISSWLIAPSAQAADAIFDTMQVEMAPTGELLGSGLDPYNLTVVVLGTDGAPVTGIIGKVKASTGQTGEVSEIGPGLYRLPWTPELVAEPEQVEIRFRGKTLDKQKIDQMWSLTVNPPYGHRVSIAVDPQQLIIGQDSQASLSVQLAGGAAAVRTGADLMFTVNSGTIGTPAPLGDGRYAALYTPPEGGAAHLALIGVADRREPSRTYGHLAIPLAVKSEVVAPSTRGCKVMLTVAGREFGPETTDSRGKARVTIVTPPGIIEAKQTNLECDAAGESTLELSPSEITRVQLMPVHAGLPGDERLQVPVRAFAVTPQGEPDGGADLTFNASHGTISSFRHEGGGVYAAVYTPPVLADVVDATIQAVLTEEGETEVASEVAFKLVPIRPTSLTMTTTPERLAKDDKSLTVQVDVKGPDGSGLAGRDIGLSLAGAKQAGPATDNGDGTYSIELTTTGRGPVEIIAAVKAPAAGNPVRDITAIPTRTRLPVDGLSSSTITILTLDEFGYPVADTDVALSLKSGDGQLPKTARTDATGMTQVTYTASRTPGLVHIELESQNVTRALGIFQLPMDAPDFTLDTGLMMPTEARATAYEQWSPIVTRTVVPRDR
ncbi:MAG TPA: hypothetical protein DFR83_23755 [Deltaproteobacteria bacterium]|nr:hypothetical protein [Deltaproteobacteria bacterium]